MMHAIEITDGVESGFLTPKLIQICEEAMDFGPRLNWQIMEWEGIFEAVVPWPGNYVGLQDDIAQTAHGVPVDWGTILELARIEHQFVNLRIEGRVPDTGEVELVIKVCDSAFWGVESTSQNVINRLKQKFISVVDVEPGVT